MRYRRTKDAVKIIILAFLCMELMLMTGCWNNKGIVEFNMVMALGVDQSEDGMVLVTIQVVEPAAMQPVSSGKGGGAQPKPVFVESYKGETVFETLRNMLSVVDKKLFLSTTQVLILGERLSRNGIDEVLDFFQRNHEADYEMDVLVARNSTPKEILEIETDMESIPAVYIKGTVKNTQARAKVKRIMFIDLIKDMGSSGRQPVIGQITKVGEKEVRTEGIAVFRDGKLAGWLDQRATRGYLFSTGEMKSTIINIPSDGGKISIEVIRSKGKVNADFKDDEPVTLTIHVSLEANVGEYHGKGKLESDDLRKLEEIVEEEVKREIRIAVNLAQKDYSSDIFGFGTQVHKYHSKYWKNVKDDWNSTFSSLPVDINVDVKIRRIGNIEY